MIVITSGCATFEPWAAALGGVVGGLIILPGSLFVSHVLKIDDPVDAFAVRPPCPRRRCTNAIIILLISMLSAFLCSRWKGNSSPYGTPFVL